MPLKLNLKGALSHTVSFVKDQAFADYLLRSFAQNIILPIFAGIMNISAETPRRILCLNFCCFQIWRMWNVAELCLLWRAYQRVGEI